MSPKSPKSRSKPAPKKQGPSKNRSEGLSQTIFVAGLVCLLIATAAAFMLVLEHLVGIKLPGCGEDSPCAQTVASAWGTVPVIDWPTSFLGFAFFLGVLLAWTSSRSAIGGIFRLFVRLGALASVLFLLVIVIEGHFCQYCLVSHAGNLAFWVLVERSGHGLFDQRRRPAVLVIAFLAVSVVLGIFEFTQKEALLAEQETAREESTGRIIDADRQRDEAGGMDGGPQPWEGGFTGRYRLGPEKARVRIVALTDYQCRDCQRLETEMMAVVEQHDDVSLSIKHFPMCTDCNPHFSRNLHANACWAARAAEAAGILKGEDGFFAMHKWLFGQEGGFTNDELQRGLMAMGCVPTDFIRTMRSAETLKRVQRDIDEGIWLGLHYTPMIFINGVEFTGIFAPNALTRTVESVLAEDPTPRTAELDQPPPAFDKCINDWLRQPERAFPQDSHPWAWGTSNARLRVLLWGDYQEPHTATADSLIRAFIAKRDDAYYSFRHYPVNQDCNPQAQVTKFTEGCLASRAAEAAGQVGGIEAYQAMHSWLFEHQAGLSEGAILSTAERLGLDRAAFAGALESQEAIDAIQEDCIATSRLGLRSIPCVIINERFVPRWRFQDRQIMNEILTRALQEEK